MLWNLFKCAVFVILIISTGCSTPKNIPEGWKKYRLGNVSLYAPKGFKLNDTKNVLLSTSERIEIKEGASDIPLTLDASFMNAFNAYHYNKFFDLVLMDPKVKKIFRDSVQLVDIYPIKNSVDKGCKNCNVMAKIKFKKKVFSYPVQMSAKDIKDHECYMHINQSSTEYEKTTFIASDECGLSKTLIKSDSGIYTIIFHGLYGHDLAIGQSIRL